MSWGDQIMDEMGFWDRERKPTMSKELMMLYGFAFWLIKNGKIKMTEKEMDKLIEDFLKDVNYEEDKKEIDKLAFLVIRNRKLLGTIFKGVDAVYIPGGKREVGENDAETLIREIKEEVSADAIPESIQYYGTFKAQAYGKPEGTVVKMTCYTVELSGEINPASEIETILWITSEDINKVAHVDKLILTDLKIKDLID